MKTKQTTIAKEWEDRVSLFINNAWNRGANWAMKGRGYAMDTDAQREIELTTELIQNLIAQTRATTLEMCLAVVGEDESKEHREGNGAVVWDNVDAEARNALRRELRQAINSLKTK